jgi:hypothetical protein
MLADLDGSAPRSEVWDWEGCLGLPLTPACGVTEQLPESERYRYTKSYLTDSPPPGWVAEPPRSSFLSNPRPVRLTMLLTLRSSSPRIRHGGLVLDRNRN